MAAKEVALGKRDAAHRHAVGRCDRGALCVGRDEEDLVIDRTQLGEQDAAQHRLGVRIGAHRQHRDRAAHTLEREVDRLQRVQNLRIDRSGVGLDLNLFRCLTLER